MDGRGDEQIIGEWMESWMGGGCYVLIDEWENAAGKPWIA